MASTAGAGAPTRAGARINTEPLGADHRRAWRLRMLGVIATRLVAIGVLVTLMHVVGFVGEDRHTIKGVAAAVTLFLVFAGPRFLRLGRSLASERAARIREQERAEVAAHLHDSVLQTLALIQRRAGDATAVATLARHQERELRRWLFERPGGAPRGEGVKSRLEAAAAEVEEMHGVPVEAVIVGDAPLHARVEALVAAAREALTNAAKWGGGGRVDLYAEIDPARVQAFVRDRGVGFDPAAIGPDRRGVRESILGRMERHGGRAAVHSAPGAGTEVELAIDLATPA
jgi:signal transduction histidine kinase